jgi:AraC-like DNA-binding protein
MRKVAHQEGAENRYSGGCIGMSEYIYPKAILLETQEPLPEWFYPVFTPLLERAGELGAEIHQMLITAGIEIPDTPLVLMQFSLPAHDKSLPVKPDSFFHQMKLLANFQKKLADRLSGYKGMSFSLYGMLFFVVYSEGNQTLYELSYEELSQQNEAEHVNMFGYISTDGYYLNAIPYLYRDITSKHQMRRYTEADSILLASGINVPNLKEKETSCDEKMVNALEQYARGINAAIRGGKCEETSVKMKEVLDYIVSCSQEREFNKALDHALEVLADFIKSITIEAETLDSAFWSGQNLNCDLTKVRNYAQCLENATAFAQTAIQYREQWKVNQDSQKLWNIRKHLKDNAADPNMSPQLLAEHFEIPQTILALRFKSAYGESINTCLHKTRIENAKRMIQSTSMGIEEIATAVGYISMSTMYRAFIKYEGIAPSKFARKS